MTHHLHGGCRLVPTGSARWVQVEPIAMKIFTDRPNKPINRRAYRFLMYEALRGDNELRDLWYEDLASVFNTLASVTKNDPAKYGGILMRDHANERNHVFRPTTEGENLDFGDDIVISKYDEIIAKLDRIIGLLSPPPE